MAKPTAQPSRTKGSPAAPNKAPTQTKAPAAPAPRPGPPAQDKLPSGAQHGYVVMVNPKEGYGFIRPKSTGREVDRDVHFGLRQVEGRRNVRAGQAVS